MRRKVIWSTHEKFIFVDMIKKEMGLNEELEDEGIENLLEEYKVENQQFLKEQIVEQFNKETQNEIIGFAVTYDSNNLRSQLAVELGNNYKNIFNIPFEKATWYADSWNIKADIKYKGMRYYYTFRVLKVKSCTKVIDSINYGRPMLTNTYLGHHTKTILRKR